MKLYTKTLIVAVCALLSSSAMAQNTNSGYFTEGYLYRYQMNPAFGNERNFIALPAIGNLNTAVRSSIALDNILYNVNGQTTTFLNPAVSADFLNDLDDINSIGTDVKINILSAGFRGFNGYNTININVRTNVATRIPKTLFSLLKEGVSNDTYDISDFEAHADLLAEVALGHSHNLGDKWRIGGAIKFLIGGANIDAQFDKAQLTLGENEWAAVTNANIQASVKGLTYEHDINENTGHEYVNGMDIDNTGINGYGVAFDLGVQFSPTKDWSFSAAILDLGFINWNNNIIASTNGDKTFTTDKYTFNVDDDEPNNFEDEWEVIKDDLSALYELDDMGDTGSRTKMLGATINVGAEYSLPCYRNLSFGLLNTTRIQGEYSWTEFRLSANIAPCKAFSAGANVAMGDYGFAFGWLMNLNVPGFNLFLGMDSTPFKLAKQGAPLSGNASVNFGINIPF